MPLLALESLHRALQNLTWDAIPLFDSMETSAALCGTIPAGATMFTEQHQDQKLNFL